MRLRAAILLAVASTTLGAGLVACFDLFHSTGDVLTACQRDAQTPGCQEEAGVTADTGTDAGTDFCAWTETEARANAESACAWLGACENPLGRNEFGSCMFAALLAYDCHANPDHAVKGKARGLWDCLWQARTCGAVDACVFPQGRPGCGGGPFVTCATQGGVPPNADVRVECYYDGGAPSGENCALWGQTCGGDLSDGVCAGTADAAAIDCTFQGCIDSMLHWCSDGGIDVGIDCASNGDQACGGFPTATTAQPALWVACLPQSEAGACTPDASAQCVNGVAVSCPAGRIESVDCNALLQSAHGCTPGPLAPIFDWTSPCSVTADLGGGAGDAGDAGDAANAGDAGDAGVGADAGSTADGGDASACSESCTGPTTLNGCYRGASFPLDCTKVGLGACHIFPTDVGAVRNAMCAPPP
jgi:hypothetical protein